MAKTRKQINDKYKWDLAGMYPDISLWEKDYKKAIKLAETYSDFKGKLATDGKTLLAAFKAADKLWQVVEKVLVYAHMKKDEDNADPKGQEFSDRAMALIAKVSAVTSFFTPEFLAIPGKKLDALFAEERGLAAYDYSIRVMLRQKKHVLSAKEENLLARLSEVTGASGDIFTMLNNADMRFGEVKDEKGAKVELTHGNYITFMESKDRKIRKGAYLAMYAQYEKYKNTLATSYSYNTKTDVVTSRIRAYDSSLARSLSADNVPLGVYDNLIEQVNENLPLMHRYMDIKAKLLGQSKLAMYDIYAPLFNLRNDKCTWDKALELMAEGLAPLGKSYVDTALAGVNDGWIDVYENVGKTSGAYSFGSYDSKPYILMNYSEKLKDVFTLVHEMGHSMHSYYTRKKQPFRYGGHSIFTAEVASTVNESLLIHHLQANSKGKNEQKYFINMHIDDFRTTLFRQTMFAEFEKLTHEAAEAGEVLTADFLSNEYGKLNEKYYGPRVVTDEQIRVEWARIPHFYRAFYVYKYATGYSAATAISSKLLAGGKAGASAVKDYLKFLESGESDDPIELLRIAGVDMDRPEPVANAMKVFGELVEKLEKLI